MSDYELTIVHNTIQVFKELGRLKELEGKTPSEILKIGLKHAKKQK